MLDETLELTEPEINEAPITKPVAIKPTAAKPLAARPKPGATAKPKPAGAVTAKAKPVAGAAKPKPAGKRPAPKKPAVAPADDDMMDDYDPPKKPKCLWAAMLLIMTMIFTILAIGIQYLSLVDKTIAAGLRPQIKNITTSISAIPMGPETAAATATAVKTTVDAAKASNDTGKESVTSLEAML